MASAAIDFGIGRILTVLENQVLMQTGLGDEIEMMKQKLRFMKSFLEDMEKHRGSTSSSSSFTNFVKTTRDLAFRIENIIDEFSYNINRRRGQIWLKRVAHLPMYTWERRSLFVKLETVNREIQEMSELMNTFPVETSQGTLPVVVDGGDTKWLRNRRESSFFVPKDSLVGIDVAREKLKGWLLDPEQQRTVITMVGMGGSGKTTLAANIFKSQPIRRQFDSRLWVTISQSYDIEDVLRTMIKEFYKEPGLKVPTDLSSMGYRTLVENLVGYLQKKRYFIVFDDVWSTGFWREITVALPDGIHGSRVMITTREERVAGSLYGTTSRSHPVEPLSEDKAWELFCKNAFSGIHELSKVPNIEHVARNLVQKCKGLPLAIVALGSMMSTRKLESEWRKVHDSLNWELRNNPDLKDIQGILALSFNDLPYPLKHCFLYCCIFPEDYDIKRKRLTRMWMAQGFVEPSTGVIPEDVADSYLMELVYRNLLQVVSRNNNGRPKVLKMHDMVREVALVVSKEERFCHVYNDRAEETHDDETRHICIQRDINSGVTQRNLHTLLVCCTHRQKVALSMGLRLLRVLDLEGSGIDEMPESLVTLFNLKYLNLKETSVEELPKSFHRLINLETLITSWSSIVQLPMGISKLKNLRYLIVNWPSTVGLSDIWKLKRLEVMDSIFAETELIKNLSTMTKLTRIGLSELRKHHVSDLCDSLPKFKDLRSLSLSWPSEEEPLQIDALSPATTIKRLVLFGKLERLPTWLKTLHSLTRLELIWSGLAEDPIPCIQALPNLVSLEFSKVYEGDRLCFPGGFQSLKVLRIEGMPRLTEIVIQKGAMPHLRRLLIMFCGGIKRVPDGIGSLTNLQELVLMSVSEELVESIRGEQSIDRSKVNHIPTITHYPFGKNTENLS